MRIHQLSTDEAVEHLLATRQLFRVMMERRSHRRDHTLTRLQRFLLASLAHRGPTAVSDLVGLLDVGPATASQFVRALESRGLITRSFDPQDRRRHLVELTDEGRRLLARVQAQQRQRLARVLGHLTAEERGQLVHLAARVAEVLGQEPDLFEPGPDPDAPAPRDHAEPPRPPKEDL